MRRALLIGWAIVVLATVAGSVLLYGIAEPGLRAGIRGTARLSTLAIALAFAGIRTREALAGLVLSHGAHFAMILTLAAITSPANVGMDHISLPGGAMLYGLMIFAAIRQPRWAIYLLWMVFIYAIVVRVHESLIYPLILAILAAAAVVRLAPRRVESATTT